MKHPFVVGSTYANNLGEYTVLEIAPPNMHVRYADGRVQTLSIAIQARIWDRLQAGSNPDLGGASAPRSRRRPRAYPNTPGASRGSRPHRAPAHGPSADVFPEQLAVGDEIVSYDEMCQREGVRLQRGMNYRIGDDHSVILMSVQPDAPYADRFEDDGLSIVYEGHDAHRTPSCPEPKSVDQPEYTPSGRLTANGKFHAAAQRHKNGVAPPERVHVYEKIRRNIWSFNGVFHLTDSWREQVKGRTVFRFRLVASEGKRDPTHPLPHAPVRHHLIPISVKREVWARDGGKCVICGSTEGLHFGYIIPGPKDGSSSTAAGIQLVCSSHNLANDGRIG